MTKQEITVVAWVSEDDVDCDGDDAITWFGGYFVPPMRWEDYLDNTGDSQKPYVEAVRKSVVENKIFLCGDEHQNNHDSIPEFNDGKFLALSMRAWGDLMAAIWAEERDRDYHYLEFYMIGWNNKD